MSDYTKFVVDNKVEPKIKDIDMKLFECLISIASESGELLEHYKKHIRDGAPIHPTHVLSELGDVLYGIVYVGSCYGYKLEDIIAKNMEKLNARKSDGK